MNEIQVVAITGTNRGLGRALALSFASQGAHVVLHARSSVALESVSAEALSCGAASVTEVVGDLLDPELGDRLARACLDNHGRLDTIILNAAILGPMLPLAETPMDIFARVMRTNVDAQIPLVSSVLPMMRSRGTGKIVWLSSGLGRFGLPGMAYIARRNTPWKG